MYRCGGSHGFPGQPLQRTVDLDAESQKSACPQSEGRGFVAFEIGKIAVKGLYPFIDPINPLVERTGTEAKRHDMIEVPNIMRPHAVGPDRVE